MTGCQTVLVTGAAGFIGSTLTDRLLAQGREVVGLDCFDAFYPARLKRQNLRPALQCSRFRLVEADVRDAGLVDRLFREARFDAVVHLAALAGVGPSLERPVAYADVNVTGTSVLLEAARRHGGPRFVFASSSSVYGERQDGPFRETDPVDRPISPYAATKKAGELVAHTFHHAHGLSVTCLRIFTAYGPRQRPDLAVRRFAERMRRGDAVPIYGDGSALRDFTYIDDLVEGMIRALDRDLGYAIVNLGSGRTISVVDAVRALEAELAVKARIDWRPPRRGDVSRTWADLERARSQLGYAAPTPFAEGIRRFVEWLAEQP